MNLFLDSFINTLTGRSLERVSTILEEAKVGKEQVAIIADRLVNFSDFAPLILTLEDTNGRIDKSPIALNFRDINVQMEELYRVDNQIADLIHSDRNILSSELAALEAEVSALEKQVQNYAFLLSEGGSYDYAYLEPFNDDLNRDAFDWTLTDRASQNFGPAEQAFVRQGEGVLAISEQSLAISALTGVIIDGNATALTITDNGIDNSTHYTSERGWRYVVGSPNPVTSGLSEANGKTGAQVYIEYSLHNPGPCTEIHIVPHAEHPIEIVRVVLFENAQTNDNPFDALDTPQLIDRPFTIHFPARTVAKFRLLLNQPIYERRAQTPSAEETYQDVVLQLGPAHTNTIDYFDRAAVFQAFLNVLSSIDPRDIDDMVYIALPREKRGRRRNRDAQRRRNIDRQRFGVIEGWQKHYNEDDIVWILADQINSGTNIQRLILPSSDTEVNVPENIFNTPLAEILRGNSPKIKGLRKLSKSFIQKFRSVYYASNGDTENGDDSVWIQPIDDVDTGPSIFPLPNGRPLVQPTYNYTYFLGIEQISAGFGSPAQKAVFVSKPFDSSGDIGEIRLKATATNVILANQNRHSNYVTSIEYSVSNVTDPRKETDWIPIIPIGDEEQIYAERFFPDGTGKGLFRFPAMRNDTITLYRNGMKVVLDNTVNYVYDASNLYVLGIKLPTGETSSTDIFTVDYVPSSSWTTINFAEKGFDTVPLVSSYDSDGAGEGFTGTNGDTVVTLSRFPYIDEDQIQDNIASGLRVGPYQPITVVLEDGTVCENITNYGPGDQSPLPSGTTLTPVFIHSDNLLLFNQSITQKFRVYYQYLKNNTRVRVVLRVNDKQFATPKVDLVHIKGRTRRPNRAKAMQ